MHAGALRALEFDRIVSAVAALALTPTGEAQLAGLHPFTDAEHVAAAQRATTEGVRFLADHPGFPLRAPADLESLLEALGVEGRALEPVRLIGLADYLESIEPARTAVRRQAAAFPLLNAVVEPVASFTRESAGVRRAIDPAGDVFDHASPKLASLRDRLRKQRTRLRATLEAFLRARDTAKYLQEQVVTDRNGRYVLVVRAEHRSAIPGILHGASASGASLFLEPLNTVEINNDVVAIEEEEAEEVRRILLALTDAFRSRPRELHGTLDAATALDVIQAKARFAGMVDGVEPVISVDGAFELRGARHPLLMKKAVPVDILLTPPDRVLIVTGPNTGGKTVAIKTAGLLAAMAQAGLHIPAERGSRLPVFGTLFADIGDEQSISASLSTFSAHITNVVSIDRDLALPALVLLDEVGAGTDPAEGGALGIAVIDRFRRRGAHLIATTHYDSLKSYASTTDRVVSAAFGFNADTFAPTYRLMYRSPGRSLAIEIAARLGMPADVIASARAHLSAREQQLAEHLARIDDDLRALEQERQLVARQREALADSELQLRVREAEVSQREDTFRRRQHERLDERAREARLEIDAIIKELKTRVAALAQEAAQQASMAPRLSTGDAGRARADARAAVDSAVNRAKETPGPKDASAPGVPADAPAAVLTAGARVTVGALGLEGTVIQVHEGHADVDVRGKRLRAALRELRVIASAAATPRPAVKLTVDLQPREHVPTDLNVIGCTVDEALSRAEKFLDDTTVTDQHSVRLIHGHGTGQLRRALAAFLKSHPLVAHFELAAPDKGGGGVTVVELKD